MPQHKSCFKRIRTSKKQNAYNRTVKSSMKTLAKKYQASTEEEAQALLREFSSELDRAVKKGVIPRRRADRKKSRIALELNRRTTA